MKTKKKQEAVETMMIKYHLQTMQKCAHEMILFPIYVIVESVVYSKKLFCSRCVVFCHQRLLWEYLDDMCG